MGGATAAGKAYLAGGAAGVMVQVKQLLLQVLFRVLQQELAHYDIIQVEVIYYNALIFSPDDC